MSQIPNDGTAATTLRTKVRLKQLPLRLFPKECRMTSQCYVPRSSQSDALGAVFMTAGGFRCFIPDRFLMEVELSEQGRLLRLIYTCCTLEVAGQRLDTLFEDAIVSRLGMVLQAPPSSLPRNEPWVSSIISIVPAAADSKLDRR